MLSSLFSKTLYERRWGIFWWSFAMFALTIMIVLLFPTFRDTFGQALQNVPESIKPILGESNDYQRINGFLELQVFMQMIFLTFIYGIILFSGLIAGEESEGTLQSLLAQPISRGRVYLEKLAAGLMMTWIVSMAMFFATWLGVAIIGEHVNLWRLLQATFGQWLVSMVFSVMAYTLGSALGRRGIAGAIAGVYAFVSYLVFTLSDTVTAFRIPDYFEPFRYYTNPRVLDNGLQLSHVALLGAACVVLAFIGYAVFSKRDVFAR